MIELSNSCDLLYDKTAFKIEHIFYERQCIFQARREDISKPVS